MGGDYSSVVPFQAAEKSPGRSAPPSASEKGTPCLLKVRVHSGRDGTSVERIVVLGKEVGNDEEESLGFI